MMYKVGMENEFSSSVYLEHNIADEFYSRQYEDNKNLYRLQSLKKVIDKNTNNSIVRISKIALVNLIKYNHQKICYYLNPNIVYFGYGSIIFNGLHITIDNSNINPNIDLENEETYRKVISNVSYNSWRKLLSHHILGYHRNSEYNFKRKSKFRPILPKEQFTELRFPELTDILIPARNEKLIRFIRLLTDKRINIDNITRNNEKLEKLFSIDSEYIGEYSEVKKIVEYISQFERFVVFKESVAREKQRRFEAFRKLKERGYIDILIHKKEVKISKNVQDIDIYDLLNSNFDNVHQKLDENYANIYRERLLELQDRSKFVEFLNLDGFHLIEVSENTYIPVNIYPVILYRKIDDNTTNTFKFEVSFRMRLHIFNDIYFSRTLRQMINNAETTIFV